MNKSKEKNILFVTPKFQAAAAKIVKLFSEYCPDNYSIYVLTFKKKHKPEKVAANYNHYESPHSESDGLFAKINTTLNRSHRIKKLAKKEDIDTVVGFLKEGGTPTVFSDLCGADIESVVAVRNNPRTKFDSLGGRIVALLYRFANQVITNSRAAEQICKTEYSMKNTATIHNPLNYQQIKEGTKKSVSEKHEYIFKSGKCFINIGRLSKQKGQWHLIRAFSKVVDENPEANLIILGKGVMREKLESLIDKCGLEENVFLLGHQDNVFSYLNAADCFVLSSMHEGLPNVVLEAKAVGLPVISVDCDTGPREILAPQLSYDESISYPYEAGNHVIVETLSGGQIFENTETKKLEPAEGSLAEAMKNKIEQGFEKKAFDYDGRHDPERVINQWVEIL